MVEDFLVRLLSQESSVGVHAVTSKECYASGGNVLLNINQEVLGGLLRGHRRIDDGLCKAAFAVCVQRGMSVDLSLAG